MCRENIIFSWRHRRLQMMESVATIKSCWKNSACFMVASNFPFHSNTELSVLRLLHCRGEAKCKLDNSTSYSTWVVDNSTAWRMNSPISDNSYPLCPFLSPPMHPGFSLTHPSSYLKRQLSINPFHSPFFHTLVTRSSSPLLLTTPLPLFLSATTPHHSVPFFTLLSYRIYSHWFSTSPTSLYCYLHPPLR